MQYKEAKPLCSYQFWVPLSAKSFCFSHRDKTRWNKKDTAPIGAKRPASLTRNNFSNVITPIIICLLCFFFSVLAKAQTPPFQQSDIPLIIIDRGEKDIGPTDKIPAQMRVVDNKNGLNDFNGPYMYDAYIGIETRGASSLIYPKKSYSIETRDSTGANLNTKLLGFPTENDWIFDGPYDDKTFMRNHLAYDLAREMGWYAPRTRFFNLVMDTSVFNISTFEFERLYEYKGVYVLLERIKRDDDRVDVSLLRPTEIDLPGTPNGFPDVTGGYIIAVDESSGSAFDGWFSSFGNFTWNYVYEYPKAGDIALQQSNYIQNFMNHFEMVMSNNTFDDPVSGYQSIINRNSFIDFIILQELSKNIDGYRKSSYFHKTKNSRDSLLYAGPIWDFNLSFGNPVNFNGNSTNGFQYQFNQEFPDNQFPVPFYWEKLMSNADFAAQVACRYNQHRGKALSNANILGKIDSMASILQTAQQLNYERYDVLNTIVSNEAPATFNSYQQAVDELKNWVAARLDFLDNQWAGQAFDVKSTSTNNSVCPATPVTLSVEGSVTGEYDWQPTTYITGSTTAASVQVVADSTITYIVSGVNDFGCIDTAKINVTIDGFATTTGGPNKAQCPGEVDTLEASGAISYMWEPITGLSDPTIANPVASPDTTTIYKVTMISQEQCEVFDFVRVRVKDIPPLSVSDDMSVCESTSVNLMATSDEFSTYVWSASPNDPSLNNTNNNVPNPLVQPTETTTYTVFAIGDNACVNTDSIQVSVVTNGELNYGGDATICNGETYQFECPTVSDILSITWSPVNGLDDPTTLCPTAAPNETTTYNIQAQTADGCNFSGTVTVNVLEGQAVYAGEDLNFCEGDTIQLNATGGGTNFEWSPTTGLSNPNIANPTLIISENITYTVNNFGDDVCDSSDDININFISNSLNAGEDVALCSSNDEGIQLTAGGGENYAWSPSAGLSSSNISNPIAKPNQTTTYTVSSTSNNCIFQDEITVSVDALNNISVGDNLILCEGVNGSLEASGGISYSWSPATALSNPNEANPTVDANQLTQEETIYTVTVTDENACSATARQKVILNDGANVNVSEDVSICSNGQTILNASGGVEYVWSPQQDSNGDTIIDDINSANPTVSPSGTQQFNVEITDANGCIFTRSITVSVADNLVVSAGNDASICSGESINLNASGGTEYSWSPTSGLSQSNTANVIASPDETTTYTVSVSDGAGCSATGEVTITVNEKPVASISGNQNICEGASTELTASGGNSYEWNSTNTNENLPNESSITVNPSKQTTYTVKVFNDAECFDEVSIDIEVNPIPRVIAGDIEAICISESVDLIASTNSINATYSWSPPTGLSETEIRNPVASPESTTTYTVTLTDQNNCIAQDDVLVIVNPLPDVSISQSSEVTCNGSSVQLEASGGQSYAWSPATGLNNSNIPNPIASPSENTNYTVTATDANGCTDSSSIQVNVGGGLTTSISEDITICIGESTPLQATGGSVYQWTPSTGLSDATIANPTASPESTLTYTVEISDATGACSAFESVTITVNNLPSAFAGPDLILCNGEQGMFQAGGGTMFSWSPVEGLSDPLISNPVVTVNENSTYTLTVSDDNGCATSDEVNVNINPSPVAVAGNNTTVCSNAIINLNGNGAGANGSYLWSPADIVSNANAQNIQVNVTETTTLLLTITDDNECTATDEVVITVAPEPDVGTSGDLSICEGGTANLFAEGGDSYLWSPADFLNDVTSPNPLCTPVGVTSIEYKVEVRNAFGCSDSKKVVVTIDDEINADAGNNETICIGESLQLNAAGGVSYTWSPAVNAANLPIIDNASISNPVVNPSETTTFIVMVSDGSCSGSDEVTITVIDDLSITLSGNTNINEGEISQLEAEGADTYTWAPDDGSLSCMDCPNPVASPAATTIYTVTGSNGNCSGSNSITVSVNACALNTTISEAVFLCDESSASLQASGGTNYQWSPDDGSLSCLDCPNPIAQPIETTTYQVIISDGNCEASDRVTVSVGSTQSIFINAEEDLCFGDVLTYDLSALASYNIIPQNGLIIEDEVANFQPTTSTDYILEGILTNGCSVNDKLQINVIARELTEISFYEICSGASVLLNEGVVLESELMWSPTNGLDNPNSANPVASPLTSTEYILSYTDNNNCKNEATFIVEVSPVSFAGVDKDVTICAGGQAQLRAFGGTAYSWSPTDHLANPNSFNPIASPVNTTTYTVRVEDDNGCADEQQVSVFVAETLAIEVEDSIRICQDGQGVRLQAKGAFEYSWSPGEGLSDVSVPNPIANPESTTVYTLTATDGSCTAVEEVLVEVIEFSLNVDAGDDIAVCEGNSIRLEAKSTNADAFQWEPRTGLSDHLSASPLASPTETTTYMVQAIVIDRENHNTILCTSFDEVTVFVEQPLTAINIPETQTICEGSSVQLEVEERQDLNYYWTPEVSLSDPTIANPIASPSASTTYQLEISNDASCTNTYEIRVNVTSLENATAGEDHIICKGDSIQLRAGGALSYEWEGDPSLSERLVSNPYVQPLESNTYYVTLTIGDCSKVDSVFVEVIDIDNITETVTVCENGATTLIAEGGESYLWSSEMPIANPSATTQMIQPNNPTIYEVQINSTNCTYTKTFDIQIGETLTASLASTYESCVGSEISLMLDGDDLSNIQWMPTIGLDNDQNANPILSVTEDASYSVSFTANNCVAELSTNILVQDSLRVLLNGSFFAICEGETQTLTASGGATYNWSPTFGLDQTNAASVVASPSETTTYTITASDESGGCSGSEQVTVIVNGFEEEAGAQDDFVACLGDDIRLSASGGTNYQWEPAGLLDNPNAAEPTVSNPTSLSGAQTFTVRITDNECVLEDLVMVTINVCLVDFIPSAFSPNGDGVNETWVIEGIHRFPNNQLNVYNRWGQLLYSSRNYQNDWAGDFRGSPLPAATYYYTLEIEAEDEVRRGTVSIIR